MGITTHDRTERRIRRVRVRIVGTTEKPRISVFRSNRYIYAQAIDDTKRVTVGSSSSLALRKGKKSENVKKTEEAMKVGVALAELLKKKNIKAAVFDRGRCSYKGRVKAVAEGLRKGGITL